jgi:hypothetical protein
MNKSRYELVLSYQSRIEAVLTRGDALLAQEGRPDTAALGQLRWEITRLLTEYQIFKHARVLDPVIARGGPGAAAAAAIKEDCVAAGDALRAHVLRWSAVSIMDQWPDYRAAARQNAKRLRAHLAVERVNFRNLLGGEAHAPPAAAVRTSRAR